MNNINLIKFGGSILSHDINKCISIIADSARGANKTLVVFGYSRILAGHLKLNNYIRGSYTNSKGVSSFTLDETVLEYSKKSCCTQGEVIEALLKERKIKAVYLDGSGKGIVIGERKKLRVLNNEGVLEKLKNDYSGIIRNIRVDIILKMFDEFDVICMGPTMYANDDETLACDSDSLIFALADCLKLNSVVIYTKEGGVIINDRIVNSINEENIDELINIATAGMKKKLYIIKKNIKNKNIAINIQ
ncbi:MAG: hypothetical protein FWE93_03580 [Alphaproteobacteria bacterium]|nr:hypothetical protein [Alphaproteobacteria bacterium]